MLKTFSVAISAVLLATLISPEMTAAQPTAGGQVRLVVPFPAGGPTDIVARPLAQMLGDALKATVVIDNRGGAGGSLGRRCRRQVGARRAHAADGHRRHACHQSHALQEIALRRGARFHADRARGDGAGRDRGAPAQPMNTVADLVALAKRMPGKLNFGSAGAGTPGHLTGEMFKSAAGIDLQHVPYRGSAPAVTDLLGGQLQLMFDPLQSVLSNMQGGKLRAIAISSKTRSSILPNVPTIAESGYDGFETTAWWGVLRRRTARRHGEALGREIERIVRGEALPQQSRAAGRAANGLDRPRFARISGG